MRILILSLYIFTFCSSVFAADQNLETFLREFHQNPEKMMNRLPPEIKDGQVIERGFLNKELLDPKLIQQKYLLRQSIMKRAEFQALPFWAPTEDDQAKALVDGPVTSNIFDLDHQGLSSGSLPFTLWSDTYWPIAQGLLANRYADGSFAHAKDWATNLASFEAVPSSMVSTDNLSPAEKYDLLVGDTNMTLTNYSWGRGKTVLGDFGVVPFWMGICHGWSAATHMRAKIPFGSIVLRAANGTPIRFYQSDVKGLTSLLWANTKTPTRFLGNRCDKSPPRDGQGRTVDDKCRDNNPASVFLSLTNQLGRNHRSFVMDATFDAEVWNYSVISYNSTYFNPQTFQQTDNVRQAIIPMSQYTIDKFRKYRGPNAVYAIGVMMDVTHLNETGPTHGVQTKPQTLTKRWIMDLELDANYNVVGGEWYSRVHPDFLWTYAPDAQARADGDADINADDWKVSQPVPPEWKMAAQKSSVSGMPLYSVLKKIVEAAPSTPPANSSAESEDGTTPPDTSGTP